MNDVFIATPHGECARVVDEAGVGIARAAERNERAAMGEAGRRYRDMHYAPARLTQLLVAYLRDAVDLHGQRRAPGAGRRQ